MQKKEFNVKRTVARVNNPKNTVILRRLGVDIVVSSTENLARILEREVETAAIRQVLSLAGGTATLVEIQIPSPFKYHGKSLSQIPISQDAVIISITRSGELLIPRGNTLLCEGDKVLCVARDEAMHQLTLDWGLNTN
ncbi:TrkA-N domain-containing protein [gut metagenome]|uniref:TrkA-N domain-containing protein n=1 Tax=gut metagenome TaxID=749906 RepID=J9D6D5_9ZZZZ